MTSRPPQSDHILLEEFFKVATRGVIAGLNPQPLPPGPDDRPGPNELNPQPIPPGVGSIAVGIVFTREGVSLDSALPQR